MAIRQFEVGAVRGLQRASGANLPDLVVVAGPNGVGKSTLMNELWRNAGTFAEPGTEVTYVGPHRPWRKSTLSTASLFQMPYSYQQILGMQSLPGWDLVAPPGLHFLAGMARDPYSSDEAQSLIKFELAKTEVQRLKHLQSEFERQGEQIAPGTLADIYKPLRDLTEFLLPHLRFDRVDISDDRNVRCWFRRVDGDAEALVDLDDLSSGEKAVITLFYPYLEAEFGRTLAPAGRQEPAQLPTTIIDEPEIHLHPTLQTSLVSYLRDLARAGTSQFILSTHSTTILDALDQDELFLLAPVSVVADGNQFVRISTTEERLEVLRSLTGSTHLVTRCRPVVFIEGEPPSQRVVSDQRLMEELLDVARGWVLVPAKSRSQVVASATRLRDAAADGLPGVPVFGLVDADRGGADPDFIVSWPVATIENLLLDPDAIWTVLRPHGNVAGLADAAAVDVELRKIAAGRELDEVRLRVPALAGPLSVERRLRDDLNVMASVTEIRARMEAALMNIDPAAVEAQLTDARTVVDGILGDRAELERFRGKEIFKTFHAEFANRAGFSYPAFVYAVASAARDLPRARRLLGEATRRIQSYVPPDLVDVATELLALPEGDDRAWAAALIDRVGEARLWWETGAGARPDLAVIRADVTRAARIAGAAGLDTVHHNLLRASVQLGSN